MVSAVNPCGFAMLPAYLGLFLGNSEGPTRQHSLARQLVRAILVAGIVSAGFMLVFGTARAAVGVGVRSLTSILPWLGASVGVLLVLAGAWLLGGGKLYIGLAAQAANRVAIPGQVGLRAYFLFGVSYGVASLSCTLPIFLAVVGSTLAVAGLSEAAGQLVLYALGMSMVISLLTVAIALFRGAMVSALRKTLPHVQPVSAGFRVLAGSYILFYWLSIGGLLQ